MYRITSLVLSCFFLLNGCYSGPSLNDTITICQSTQSYFTFKNCINQVWYKEIYAQGYSNDSLVQLVVARLNVIGEQVRSGQISHSQGIAMARLVQTEMSQRVSNQNLQAMQNLGNSLQNYGTPTNESSTKRCKKINEPYGQIYLFKNFCPAGYIPA